MKKTLLMTFIGRLLEYISCLIYRFQYYQDDNDNESISETLALILVKNPKN